MANYADSSTYSTASGRDGLQYVVLQVTLKEKFLGTGSGNLSALEEVLKEVIAKNPKAIADYKGGKEKALGALVGQTMKAMKGKANPGMVNKILKELL